MRSPLSAAAFGFALLAAIGCGGPSRPAEDAAKIPAAEETEPKPDGECEGAACVAVCDKGGRPLDCLAAARLLHEGDTGVQKDEAKSVVAFEKSCNGNESDGCMELAQIYAANESTEAKATPFYEKGCALKDRNACYELGEKNQGPENAENYVKYHTLGCDLGRGQSCDNLAKRADAGTDGKKDHAAAIGFLFKGCAAADYQVWTCNTLQTAVAKKDKLAVKGVDTWKKACTGGDKTACTGIERLTAAAAALAKK